MSSTSVPPNAIEVNQPAQTESTQQTNDENDGDDCVITKKRRKTSAIWDDFDQVETENGVKGKCKYCKNIFSYSGKGASTTHLWRHTKTCLQRKLHVPSQKKIHHSISTFKYEHQSISSTEC